VEEKLPDSAGLCANCGKVPFRAEIANLTERQEGTIAQVQPSVQPVVPTQRTALSSTAVPSGSYKWAVVYGWFMIAAAAWLLLTGALTLLSHQDVIPPPSAFARSRTIGVAGALSQGFLWAVTGLAILRRKLIAVRFMWAVVVLAGLGVLFRGIVPLDLVVWLSSFALAKWFSSKRPFLSK
jgi:hypothetical protein